MKTLTLLFVLLLAGANAAVLTPEAECSRVHHLPTKFASYINQNCLVWCMVHSNSYYHKVNEGAQCGFQNIGNCINGICVPREANYGYVDIELISATVNTTGNLLATSTVRNHLGLNLDKKEFQCSSNIVPSTSMPDWSFICEHSDQVVFSTKADITLQLRDVTKFPDQITTTTTEIGHGVVGLTELINRKELGKVIQVNLLKNGTESVVGQINVRVNYTPVLY